MDQFRPQLAEQGSAPSSLPRRARSGVVEFLKTAKSIGEDDPRRIIHSFKVGLALTLVSVFYYATPLFDSFGVSTMWAVLTVVVVMEYTVGGTLSKGLNRAFATLVAGALGIAAHEGAALCGEKGEPVLLALFVFLLAASATFSRFIPEIKARYDYGVTIFILTFSLVAVSSYRVDELLQLAHQRLSTVAIGVATCLATTIFVFPVWAGEDLHQLVAGNLEILATFLQGLAAEYFAEKGTVENESVGKSFLKVPTSVLNSKAAEDSLANSARWEPCHGGFWFRHPWKQYLRIGALSRQCASTMDALAACAVAFPEHKPSGADPDLHFRIRAACREMSSESAEALRELSSAMRAMAAPASASRHAAVAAAAVAELRSALSATDGVAAARDILHVATAASLLAQAVAGTQAIAGAVEELARLARFKRCDDPVRDGKVTPDPEAGTELDP